MITRCTRRAALASLPGLVMGVAAAAAETNDIRVPVANGYVYPRRNAMEIEKGKGVSGWADPALSLVWYGDLRAAGELTPRVELRLPAGERVRLRLTVTPGGVNDAREMDAAFLVAEVTGEGENRPVLARFRREGGRALYIDRTGYTRFTLSGLSRSGATFGTIDALLLSGPAARDARFNTTGQRGAASVHLHYPVPESFGPVTAFYTEVRATADPITTYYCTAGWNRGYFGYQVNSPTERRIIFSVWDAGGEPTDPSKVAAYDRVELLEKGSDVVGSRFGNEGTGGHSHLIYPWRTGDTYRFLVTGHPGGPNHAIYTGWFYFPERQNWGLIARFRAPLRPQAGKPGEDGYLHNLYAFDEDFWGDNGDLPRRAEFANQWARTGPEGTWHELTEAVFTHTARDLSRPDFAAGPTESGSGFFLATGGFVAPERPIRYGNHLHRTAGRAHPPTDIPSSL